MLIARGSEGGGHGEATLGTLPLLAAADDPRTAPVLAGQGVGMVTDVEPVGHVIDRLCTGARELLAGWGQTACT